MLLFYVSHMTYPEKHTVQTHILILCTFACADNNDDDDDVSSKQQLVFLSVSCTGVRTCFLESIFSRIAITVRYTQTKRVLNAVAED